MAEDDNYTVYDDEPPTADDDAKLGAVRSESAERATPGSFSTLVGELGRSGRLIRAGVLFVAGVVVLLLAGWAGTSHWAVFLQNTDEESVGTFGASEAFFHTLSLPLGILGAVLIAAAVLLVVVPFAGRDIAPPDVPDDLPPMTDGDPPE